MDVFVYGTLRDSELVARLTRRRFATQPAVLVGYGRIGPPDSYPYIVADAEGRVHGLVLVDVDPEALAALDRYEAEGELYRRVAVDVLVEGRPRPAWAYIGIPAAHPVRIPRS